MNIGIGKIGTSHYMKSLHIFSTLKFLWEKMISQHFNAEPFLKKTSCTNTWEYKLLKKNHTV